MSSVFLFLVFLLCSLLVSAKVTLRVHVDVDGEEKASHQKQELPIQKQINQTKSSSSAHPIVGSVPNAVCINRASINLIEGFEGFRANWYYDSVGVRTIGYG
jgi:hypothetical protein